MIRFCCESMINLASEPGEKGFSLLALRDGDFRRFYLQARPFDPDFISRRDDNSSLKGVPIAIAMNLSILYCPSCGSNLSTIIEQQRELFDEFAASVSHLIPSK